MYKFNNDEIKLAESKLGAFEKFIAKPYNRDDIEAVIVLALHKEEEKDPFSSFVST